jgi:hypothetical protein
MDREMENARHSPRGAPRLSLFAFGIFSIAWEKRFVKSFWGMGIFENDMYEQGFPARERALGHEKKRRLPLFSFYLQKVSI